MSADLLLLLAALVLLAAAPFALLRRRRRRGAARPAPAAAAPRTGLSFQRPVAPVSRAAEMQAAMADKPPMFASSPAVFEGETAPERLPSSSS